MSRPKQFEPYDLHEVLFRQTQAYIVAQCLAYQHHAIGNVRGCAHAMSLRSGTDYQSAVVSRMLRGGLEALDRRTHPAPIRPVGAKFLRDWVKTYGSPGTVQRVKHSQTFNAEIVVVPYDAEVFAKLSIRSGFDFDKAQPVSSVISDSVREFAERKTLQGVMAKRDLYSFEKYGILTDSLLASLTATNRSEEKIILASVAKCREMCMRKSLDVLDYLNTTIERHHLGLEPLPLPWREITTVPGSDLGIVIVDALNAAKLSIKDFAATCGMRDTTIEDIIDDEDRLVKTHETIKLSTGLRLLDPIWTPSRLREAAPTRFTMPRS
jgi:hypothetical protein